ncbi:ATP-binding protein [Aromatoleum petrolei]|uniref:histidine kinase n=1 Tax=Aromatoleum petrolei TaxID=76116 RepID=A0ABX1MIH6_9RHOO|nr:ATP-binding protein [Aromatoleum petrolei]NMF86920.1 PAS domain S-box protein [Aromatoleum petrolei]QTQ37513.1 Putative two component system histidine kinase [Aromatoleum petrolei]
MFKRLSIRRRLALHVVLTGFVMLALSIVFVLSQRASDEVERRIFEHELAPAKQLHRVELRLLSIHGHLQDVLLGIATPAGIPELIAREGELIRENWQAFLQAHWVWPTDLAEGGRIADMEKALPELWLFLERASAASRNQDAKELDRLLRFDWYSLRQTVFEPLRELAEAQDHHVEHARQSLADSRRRAELLVGSLLGLGVLLLSGFAVGLMRYMTRRIANIETALEQVAAGGEVKPVPYGRGEDEMSRIADAINRTVTRLREKQDAISRLMQRQRTVLDAVAEGIYGIDDSGRVNFVNPAALAMLGYDEHEALGQHSHTLMHHHRADGRPYPLSECPVYASRGSGKVVTHVGDVFFRKDGTHFPVELTSAPLRSGDGQGGCVVVFHDISERLEKDRLLRESIAQLEQTNARLRETQSQLLQAEKLAGLGQLAAGMAHEINNPLGFIQSDLNALESYLKDLFDLIVDFEMLVRQRGDSGLHEGFMQLQARSEIDFIRDDASTLLSETREGVRRIARIVTDLKDFARLDAALETADADLQKALDNTVRVMHATLAEKAEIVRDYESIPLVRCNLGQINQVFVNLLLNAAHAIRERGTITLRTRHVGNEVCVEIADDGRGMDATERSRMFDPFFTTKPVGEGTGLGLSVSYSIVRSHEGRFEVDSTPGVGTVVRLWLPAGGRGGV